MEIKNVSLEIKIKVNDSEITVEDWGLSPKGSRVFTVRKETETWFTLYVSNQKVKPTVVIKKDNKMKKHVMRPGSEGTRLKDIFKKAFEMAE